ncbi:RNA polymerase sigma factor [Halalkalibacter akibai]|uniref:RNA polymerase sigma-70 factor n=1 Tax=Halalkalibacter akibai (strain ATCC 43226 / DSM 21942 / CIP 109018 / JCM 9157 / 1139) TaxID=1236973 RepID=W4R009_HALA3|nr:sigma-70 family RNA polymerase sigma factor [Halalkalibacter akibai]GAE37671.1 RNA polymerase sigma-70 factor [Halalkalibacter akibai JCM 9157]
MGHLTDLYKENFALVFKYLMTLCRDTDVAEELTQETFYKAIHSIERFNGSCKISVWLCQIAKHTYYQYVDKQVKQPELSELQVSPSIEQLLIEQEDKIELYRYIHQLKEPYREILHLRLLGGLSFQEIGEILEKNENWARVTFYRAKVKLQEEVKRSE